MSENYKNQYSDSYGEAKDLAYSSPFYFELVGFRKGDDGKDLSVNGKCPYFRVLIRNKNPEK